MSDNIYNIKLEQYEGPLDLLLQLIEEEKLDITKISLSKVADQFIIYVNQSENMNPEEVADFLVVASKLLLIKSKILLPGLEINDEEAGDLEKQLKIYKEYFEASKIIEKLIHRKKFTFAREKPIRVITPKFVPPKQFGLERMKEMFMAVLKSIEPIVNLPKDVIRRTISINEKIKRIKDMILEKVTFSFKKLIGQKGDKLEIIVSFLALLELVKQRTVSVKQLGIFEEIEIERMEVEITETRATVITQ